MTSSRSVGGEALFDWKSEAGCWKPGKRVWTSSSIRLSFFRSSSLVALTSSHHFENVLPLAGSAVSDLIRLARE